jgi:serine protease
MVLPVRVLGKCGGSDSDIIAAMYWAAGIAIPGDTSTPVNPHPAQVISMSLGKTGSCPASYNNVFAALAAARVTVVIAAGNSNGLAVEAPANCSGALAVAGVRHIGSKVGYSSIGPQVTIAAPAGNCVNTTGACLYPILTTTNKGTTTPSTNGYSDSSAPSLGTSFSTPIVAGAVALMLAVDPTLTPAAIAAKLKSTARPFPSSGAGNDSSTGLPVAACKAPTAAEQLECYCTTTTCGAGMLDIGAAVAAVVPVVVAPPTTAIAVSNASPTAGASVTLSASGATANGGRSIAGYQWQITSGGSFAAFSGATNAASATLLTSAAGSVVVSLTVTDSAGASGSASSTLSVQAAPTPVTPSSSGGTPSSSGGGGAMSAVWVAWLGVAACALRRANRRAAGSP